MKKQCERCGKVVRNWRKTGKGKDKNIEYYCDDCAGLKK